MRIIYLGNHDIGIRCLAELINRNENIVAVFALPKGYWDKLTGVDHQGFGSETVDSFARSHDLTVYNPEDINSEEYVDIVRNLQPDVLLSVSWDQMVNETILSIPKIGCFNLHDSLLPENRGHAPINWAIIHGYTRTGITMHHMVQKADQGGILGQREVEISLDDTTYDVYLRILDAGVELFTEVFNSIKEGQIQSTPQKHHLGTYGKRRKPVDGLIDWNQSAFDIYNRIRALTHPYPGAFTYFRGIKMLTWQARLYENTSNLGNPGQVIEGLQRDGLRVAAGSGSIVLQRLQLCEEDEIHALTLAGKHAIHEGELLGMLPKC